MPLYIKHIKPAEQSRKKRSNLNTGSGVAETGITFWPIPIIVQSMREHDARRGFIRVRFPFGGETEKNERDTQ